MRLFYIIIVIFLLFACEKTEKERYTYTGNFVGHITGDSLHWFNGSHTPASSVKIIFDRGDKKLSTSTDSLGNFEFNNIPYGTYNITLSANNYTPSYYPGYQLYFTDVNKEDQFYIFKKKRIEKIKVELVTLNGHDNFHQVTCEGGFSEDERVELIVFLNGSEEADYNNYTSYKEISYDYCQGCFNFLFLDYDSLSTSSYYAIYPVLGFNWPAYNWHMLDNIRDYEIVFDKDIEYKGYYDKNISNSTF